jgi:predicted transcriptional regulator YdeE
MPQQESSESVIATVERGPLLLVGIEVCATFEELWTEMPRAWQAFFSRVDEIRGARPGGYLDVSVVVNDGVYTQLVCAEVDTADDVPEGMTVLRVPAQHYLRLQHSGPEQEIADAFGRMYEWANREGVRADEFKVDRGYGTDAGHELLVHIAS